MHKRNTQFVILFFSIFCLLVSCMEPMPSSDLSETELRGPVKMMKETFFFAENSFEKVIPEVKFYSKTLRFDYKGRLLETTFTNYLLKNSVDTVPSLPDSIIKPQIEQFEDAFIRKAYFYTTEGACIINIYNKERKIIAYEERTSLNGRLFQINRYSGYSDKLVSKTNFTYTSQGRIQTERTYFEKNYTEQRYRYQVGAKYKSFNFTFENFRYTYNRQNQLISMLRYWGDNLLSTTYYTYNKQGDVILQKEIDEASKLTEETSFMYTYDKYGNWLTCIERRFDGNVFVRERTIIYYQTVL